MLNSSILATQDINKATALVAPHLFLVPLNVCFAA